MKTTTEKSTTKMVKVKFNCATAIKKRPELTDISEKMDIREMTYRMTPLISSQVVHCGEIVELTEEEYNQVKDRRVTVSTGKGGDFNKLKFLVQDNGLTSDTPFSREVEVPLCEIVA